MTRSLSSITTLAIVLFALVTYNFIGAWTAAPASPPNSNVAAPINVSGSPQAKAGNFGANRVDALVQMRSPEYCDENGANCFGPSAIATGGGASCSIGSIPNSQGSCSAGPAEHAMIVDGYECTGGSTYTTGKYQCQDGNWFTVTGPEY